METRKDRNDRVVTIAIVTGAIMLLLGLCLGALAGGVGGYLIGRQASAGTNQAFSERVVPETRDQNSRQLPDLVEPFELPGRLAEINGGALVREVVAGSPAEAAGLEAGDIITEFDGARIDANHPLEELVAEKRPGDTVELALLRNGETRSINVELGAAVRDSRSAYLGIRFVALNVGTVKPTPAP